MTSVVQVLPDWPPNKRRNEEPEGSGVVVLDGSLIVTAAHVLADARSVRVATADGEILSARIVGEDRATDLALLAIDRELPALDFAGDARQGEEACAVGNAFGLGLSISCGTVSAINRAGTGFNPIEDFVQTDAAVNPGASGGALLDGEGRLIGILSAIFTKQSDANIGVNFAVSAPLAARVTRALATDGTVHHFSAGMALERSPKPGETGRYGARVNRLLPGGAAEQAGLAVGDIIISAGPRRVRAPADLVSALARLELLAKLELTVLRDGRETTLILSVDK